MSIDHFFNLTEIEFQAHIQAYYDQLNYSSWLNGLYNYQATVSALSMLISKKKSDIIEYPKYPIETKKQTKQERSELEADQEFRNILLNCY